MISAQIKKGNAYLIDSLQDYLLQNIVLPDSRTLKTVKFNYYYFIQTVSEILNQYAKSKCNISFNLFIVDNYVRKYQKSSDLYRHFFGLTQAWKRFIDVHEDAKLFLSLISSQRNNRQAIKKFIKIRRTILKTIDAKILQQISVTHSDALTICHLLFEGEDRNKIIKKINCLFISLKRKLVNTAKINGAVACQFFMSASQQLETENYPLQQLNKNTINQRQKQRATKFQNKNHNYDLSFSEQYASCYAKQNNQNRQSPIQDEEYQEDQQCGEQHRLTANYKQDGVIYEEIQDLQKQWEEQKGILDLKDAKKSLNQLSKKDKDIDAKLHCSGLIKLKKYPEGWDKFINNNKMQKQKLLHGSRR